MATPTLIRKLPLNTLGKDYVVGDLHGCYEQLERLLGKVDFDPTHDRLFSVGDLVDRGPDSLRCLQLLAEPWFYAVLGNHEAMLLEFFLPYLQSGRISLPKKLYDSDFLDNGGEWVEQYFLAGQNRMSDAFNRCLVNLLELPLIQVVGEGKNRFHIIHAELVKSRNNSASPTVWLDADIDYWFENQSISAKIEEHLLWGRTLMTYRSSNQLDAIQPGLSTTFCGHNINTAPCRTLSHLCLDTGAFVSWQSHVLSGQDNGYSLTLFDVQESCWFSASYLSKEIIRGNVSA